MADAVPKATAAPVQIAETGAGRFQVEAVAAGARFLVDEPVAFGGLGSGPNPYDLLGASLGACTAMTLRLYAERKGWPLARVRVQVAHRRDALAARDVFDREIAIEGPLDEAQTARLMEIAERCPVHLTLQRGADVHTRLSEGSGGAATPAGQHAHAMAEACADP